MVQGMEPRVSHTPGMLHSWVPFWQDCLTVRDTV